MLGKLVMNLLKLIVINNPVKHNITKTPVRGAFTTFADRSIPPFTLPEYLRLATSPKYLTPSHSSYEELEQLYWEQNQDASSLSPIYGADVQTTLTDPDQQVFNLTKLPSLISGMTEQIPGIHQPYVYIGMWTGLNLEHFWGWLSGSLEYFGNKSKHFRQ